MVETKTRQELELLSALKWNSMLCVLCVVCTTCVLCVVLCVHRTRMRVLCLCMGRGTSVNNTVYTEACTSGSVFLEHGGMFYDEFKSYMILHQTKLMHGRPLHAV